MAEAIDAEARSMVAGCAPEVLARAVNYLYTETKSSFEIERETATRSVPSVSSRPCAPPAPSI